VRRAAVKQGCGGEEVRNRKKEDDRGEWPTSGASENRRDGTGRKKTKHMSVRPHRVSWWWRVHCWLEIKGRERVGLNRQNSRMLFPCLALM
jgi:hypothetical protein